MNVFGLTLVFSPRYETDTELLNRRIACNENVWGENCRNWNIAAYFLETEPELISAAPKSKRFMSISFCLCLG